MSFFTINPVLTVSFIKYTILFSSFWNQTFLRNNSTLLQNKITSLVVYRDYEKERERKEFFVNYILSLKEKQTKRTKFFKMNIIHHLYTSSFFTSEIDQKMTMFNAWGNIWKELEWSVNCREICHYRSVIFLILKEKKWSF